MTISDSQKKTLDSFTWGGSGMVREAAEWIIENIPHGEIVLEIGAALTSTEFLSNYWKTYSVEQDKRWMTIKNNNLNYIHAPLVGGWYDVNCLTNQLPKEYSMILIDGPVYGDRHKIIDNIGLFDIEDTVIIVDDTYRKKERNIVNELLKLGKEIILEGTERGAPQFTVLK
jgi:hypothetical protein